VKKTWKLAFTFVFKLKLPPIVGCNQKALGRTMSFLIKFEKKASLLKDVKLNMVLVMRHSSLIYMDQEK
jgi:hypothetical protein